MRQSKYWDDFDRRIDETVEAVKSGTEPLVRRIAVFVTDRCNFRCEYCNSDHRGAVMDKAKFIETVEKYGDTAIIHITGGEPSTVSWLYPYLKENGDKYRFHLNTNAFIKPPSSSLRRLKVSLDNTSAAKWDKIVGRSGAWNQVVANIKEACSETVVSITYCLSKKTFRDAVAFAKFAKTEFPGLYAVFFSVYKGDHPDYQFSKEDVTEFWNIIMPELLTELDEESKALIRETLDEKKRIMEGTRFEQNSTSGTCHLSMTERVISPTGQTTRCSHLYRDGLMLCEPLKHEKCKYGCNRRLVAFNEEVCKRLDK